MLPFFTELSHRLTLPTPTFWKRLQKRTAATSAAFTTLTVAVASLSSLPPIIPTACGYIAASFGAIAAACSLAVDDATQLPTAEPTPPSEPTTT
jgi:hypothetical protein